MSVFIKTRFDWICLVGVNGVYQEFSMILTQYGRHGNVFQHLSLTDGIKSWSTPHSLIWHVSIQIGNDSHCLLLFLGSCPFEFYQEPPGLPQVILLESCSFCRKDFKMLDCWRGCPPTPTPEPHTPLKEVFKDHNNHLLVCFVYWRLFHPP